MTTSDTSMDASATTTAPLSAALPHLIVAHHLRAHGFVSTLKAFQLDAAQAGVELPDDLLSSAEDTSAHATNAAAADAAFKAAQLIPPALELPNLLAAFTEHQRALAAQAAARASSEAQRERHLTERARLLALALPGPVTLPFSLHATFRTLHASNILSITLVQLPLRRFSTATARFETSLRPALATTAADRRVVLSDPESGEMLECLEGAQGAAQGHRAAVLCTAQNPALPRELVSTSMDSTVLVWDLIAGGGAPVQVLKDHTRFVVRAAYSQDGRFLATAGYDRKLNIYQREPSPTSSSALQAENGEDEDESEPEAIRNPFKLVKTINTQGGNPEAIVFLSTKLLPLPEADGTDIIEPGLAARDRIWLAFSCRGECHINYVALPRIHAELGSTDGEENLAEQMQAVTLASDAGAAPSALEEPEDFTIVKCNTNENVDDWHVSYSLLSLALHPSGTYLSAHTGDHTRPSSISTTGETYLAPPKILLVQPLRPGRVHTLFLPPAHNAAAALGGGTSLSPSPRHAWIQPGGEALWVAGEDGRVRLLDVKCETERGESARLRAEVWTQGRADDADDDDPDGQESGQRIRLRDAEQEASALWSRGGNTVIKDICVIDDAGTLATCGFDHTVRIVRRRKES
ncbi:hypothetical protein OC842_007140 [Tilletia horrida]|uniref:LisH domain-containing protein n=1 Tax=Tilletia horrida TaxID=155126 RepID=A0AAN6G6M7_9BASI|nr:hypothetical protein OC842_007140 [Tilletia horrida]